VNVPPSSFASKTITSIIIADGKGNEEEGRGKDKEKVISDVDAALKVRKLKLINNNSVGIFLVLQQSHEPWIMGFLLLCLLLPHLLLLPLLHHQFHLVHLTYCNKLP